MHDSGVLCVQLMSVNHLILSASHFFVHFSSEVIPHDLVKLVVHALCLETVIAKLNLVPC